MRSPAGSPARNSLPKVPETLPAYARVDLSGKSGNLGPDGESRARREPPAPSQFKGGRGLSAVQVVGCWRRPGPVRTVPDALLRQVPGQVRVPVVDVDRLAVLAQAGGQR
ncbi:hypothetical protein GCM10010176_102890 [Nonomuraea spiralis]|nr:hypothetical protein GCM10010176_102890 [Nonomuraea spiralis]